MVDRAHIIRSIAFHRVVRPRPTAALTGRGRLASVTMEEREEPLVDFGAVPRRLQSVTGVVGALALLGCVIDGALNGLTFALMGRWVGIFVVGMVAGMAVATALHALGGADRAGRRGERLSSPDVGLSPRRLASVDDPPAHDPLTQPDPLAPQAEGGAAGLAAGPAPGTDWADGP